MGTNAFKQIVRTIQNKIPVSKGLIRRSRETEQGYLADIHNFELEDGTLKFRQGTRLMANMVDELWYDIQSFKFGNTELVMGINYKRELWGWLAKWPETSFKIWNTSPFRRTYPHVINGVAVTSGHFSFERGNKFYLLEDNFSVILVNDYAEIFRIMKNGCFRITTDDDYADQRIAIQDARDDDSLREGRIYLDIKEATNRVFNERMHIGDETINRSHRISGETRFAWVNELNVVSELSDPINIEGYKHLVASAFPVVNYDKYNKFVPIERIVQPNTFAGLGSIIYENTPAGIVIGANAGESWNPTCPYSKAHQLRGIIVCIKEGGTVMQGGTYQAFPAGTSGIYLSLCKRNANPALPYEPIDLEALEYNYNFIEMTITDVVGSCLPVPNTSIVLFHKGKNLIKVFQPTSLNALDLPRLVRATSGDDYGVDPSHIIPKEITGVSAIFEDDQIISDVGGHSTGWIKLSDSYDKEIYGERQNVLKSTTSTEYFITGAIYEVVLNVYSENAFNELKTAWSPLMIRGIESDSDLFTKLWTMWENKGFDCWDYLGYVDGVTVTGIDLEKKGIVVEGVDEDVDIIMACEEAEAFEYIKNAKARFCVWNNSHIQGISQRFFVKETSGEIVYEGEFQFEQDNLNVRDDEIGYEDYVIGHAPLMTLDYTGLRRIPMPLPMIRRAMRNPQHLTTAGGKVYSVEDNKIWVGSVDDFMMTDFIEIHSAVDHIASMDTGIVVSTRQGLFYVASGEGIKRVIGGEMIMSKFLAPCSGGVLSVDGRDIHIIYKQVTDSGAWYPSVAKINNALTEINLEGEIKSVSIGDMIYIADDWNVWTYDMANKVWAGKKHYKNRIHRLFGYKNKLGVAFETGVDRRNSFPKEGGEKE